MRWAFLEFTHYSGDDTQLDHFADADFTILEAASLPDLIPTLVRLADGPIARIDDHDSPYGSVYTTAHLVRRYFKLHDATLARTPCYAVFAESVFARDFNQMPVLTLPSPERP